MVLKRSEKNELLELIAEHDLQPNDFRLTQDDGSTVVYHESSGSEFAILRGRPTTAIAKVGNYQAVQLSETWPDLKHEFGRWLDDIKVELVTPDLWEELRQGAQFLSQSTVEDIANTPFTPAELAQLARQIREIKDYLKESRDLSEEQFERIEARLDHAEEASQRLGKKDWILLFLGTLFSVVGSGLLPPEVLQHVLSMAAHRIGHLFGGGPPPLPPQA